MLHNPEQFIERNTDYSWQGYLLSNVSCQRTWADAIIIQAVANSFNLLIHIAKSNETFSPITIVQPVNMMSGCRNIYFGHIGETHYVSTVEKQSSSAVLAGTKCTQSLVGDKPIDKNEKHRAYMKEYMGKRRADPEFKKRDNEALLLRRHKNSNTSRENINRAARKRK